MGAQEALGHQLETAGVAVIVSIHDNRDDELAALDAADALARQGPFLAEETFLARLGVGGNQREKQVAAIDGVPDLPSQSSPGFSSLLSNQAMSAPMSCKPAKSWRAAARSLRE